MLFFFFQAEDGIRDYKVTGVQTCALPICGHPAWSAAAVRRHGGRPWPAPGSDRKSTRLNSSHLVISYAVFCLKKKMKLALQTPNVPRFLNESCPRTVVCMPELLHNLLA